MSKKNSVAVIDDDASFRESLVDLLLLQGYHAVGFESAEHFLAGRWSDFDCIITDLHMTGMTGFDLKHRLDAEGCASPFILITARTDPNLQARSTAEGIFCLLRKPFETRDLTFCLEKGLASLK